MKKNVLILAGGTGGHIVPGIALAQAMYQRGFVVHLLTLTKNRGYADFQNFDLPLHYHAAPPLPKKIISLNTCLFIPRFVWALWQALRTLHRNKINLVVGMGGYPMLAGLCAARLLRCNYYLCEQNAVAGKASRLFASQAEAFFINFPLTHLINIPPNKLHKIGSPLRPQFAHELQALKKSKTKGLKRKGFQKNMWNILVLGGSQGALQINKIAWELVQQTGKNFNWTLQCGEAHLKELAEQLPSQQYPHVKLIGYTENIAELYTKAQILICRAGAGVITEALCFGLPLLLVPYPYAADGHQYANADYLVNAGAALSFRQKHSNPRDILEILKLLARHPERVSSMREAALKLAEPQASSKIAKAIAKINEHTGLN